MRISEKTINAVSNRASRPLRVLIVEDSEPDALLLKRALERGGFSPITKRVYAAEAMDQALHRRPNPRRPKEARNPRSEKITNAYRFDIDSDFGLRASFGFRPSDFGLRSYFCSSL